MANRAAQIRLENVGKPVLRRGRRFIEFDLGNGVTRRVATIDRLHLADLTTEVDTTIVADAGAWQWKMAAGDYQFHARSVFNVGGLMEWRKGAEWIQFDPQSINWVDENTSRQQIAIKQAITGQVADNVLSFPAAYGAGRHFRYEATPRQLRKFITIDALANLPAETLTGNTIWFEAEFSIATSTGVDFYLDGVRWAKTNNVRVTTANRIEIRDAATGTQVLWYIDQPTATDANGDTVVGQFECRRQGGASNLFITVRIPRAWILVAAFPIVIDPTFTDGQGGDVSTFKDTAVHSGSPTFNFGADTSFLGPTASKGLFFFDCSSIASGSTCNTATVTLYHDFQGAAQAFTLTCYSIASGNANWAEGTKAGTLAGAGEPCWNAYAADGAGGVTTAWAGSAGLATSGTDYEASSLATANGNRSDVVATAYSLALTASRVANWFGASNTNYGLLVVNNAATGGISSSDHATTSQRPKLVVDYTAAGGVSVKKFALIGVGA